MEVWIDDPEETITVPQVGGIAKTHDGSTLAFVGFDPDLAVMSTAGARPGNSG